MATYPVNTTQRITPRTAVLASADLSFRQRVRDALAGLRWQVREAGGGAEALAHLEASPAEAMILDSWLPDLEVREFVAEFTRRHPGVDLVTVDEPSAVRAGTRSPRRNEVLHALRQGQDAAQDADGAIWNSAPVLEERDAPVYGRSASTSQAPMRPATHAAAGAESASQTGEAARRLPEFIGTHPEMLEVSRRIRLVAPRTTPVLVQGATGTGKELVARALHRLSPRSAKPFVALNCAAIPDALLEAELFGHTRGAFTGAVQGRTGRVETAHGGTLFLDEIGEMPLALQAKLLRFVESGEVQRVGENEPVRVDVRIVAATHQSLAQRAAEGEFRADLYYRLAVFLIRTPRLSAHAEDMPGLSDHFMKRLGQESPAKTLTAAAMERLAAHAWPGNVRELEHVIERAWILAEDRPQIDAAEIEFGEAAL